MAMQQTDGWMNLPLGVLMAINIKIIILWVVTSRIWYIGTNTLEGPAASSWQKKMEATHCSETHVPTFKPAECHTLDVHSVNYSYIFIYLCTIYK
jgi:hypothetical protein